MVVITPTGGLIVSRENRHPELKAWIGAIVILVNYVCEEMNCKPEHVLKAILMHIRTRKEPTK
jgi:hypothetical protein